MLHVVLGLVERINQSANRKNEEKPLNQSPHLVSVVDFDSELDNKNNIMIGPNALEML